jgi:DNA repair exonuclease SbcCD ATPase subunit
LWKAKHDEDLARLVADYDELSKIDIEAELIAHKDLAVYNEKKKQKDIHQSLLARQTAWLQKQDKDISELQKKYDELNSIDFSFELAQHQALATYNKNKTEQETLKATINTQSKSIDKEKKLIEKLEKEVKTLEEHKCYACGQDFHDDKHVEVMLEKSALLEQAKSDLSELQNNLEKNKNLVIDLGLAPITHYKTEAEAIRSSTEVENVKSKIDSKKAEVSPFIEQLAEHSDVVVGVMPVTVYDTEVEAIEHRSTVNSLLTQIATKNDETDPYSEQVVEMESNALQAIDFEAINKLTRTMEHQKFLLDLLVSKDSFVRKKIIDQNLSYLNQRLTHYLDKIGLPHQVIFQNDLQVEITELGRELDFDNLSRGERNRLILGLSFAFRDVWESLYRPINTLFIDELIDSGLDTIGVENSIAILKDMSRRRQKSIWLVSHREELAGRVPSVLKVIKENGFTSYSTSVDTE